VNNPIHAKVVPSSATAVNGTGMVTSGSHEFEQRTIRRT
jgi:hypothetical protein